jgi:hypothetical protein
MAIIPAERDNVLKRIFEDGWEEFKQNNPRYLGADEVVQKMMGCGNSSNGYACLLCL